MFCCTKSMIKLKWYNDNTNNKNVIKSYHKAGNILRTLWLPHLNLIATLWGSFYYYLHFSVKEKQI